MSLNRRQISLFAGLLRLEADDIQKEKVRVRGTSSVLRVREKIGEEKKRQEESDIWMTMDL